MPLSDRVTARQRELGLTRRALGARATLSNRTLIDVYRGSCPRLPTLEKLSRALDVSLCWLLTGLGPQSVDEFNRMVQEWEASNGKTKQT